MSRIYRIIIVLVFCALLSACQPTPDKAAVVNKGDAGDHRLFNITIAAAER